MVAGSKADLVLTGEMSHHEVLDLTQAGVSVLLADHSNTERGFLAVMQERLTTWLPGTTTLLSTEVKHIAWTMGDSAGLHKGL